MIKLRPTRRGVRILPALLWSVVFIAMFSDPASTQTAVLSQSPNHIDSHMSDAKLQSFPLLPNPTGVCVADNFILSSETTIAQIRIWGIYFPGGNSAPAIDNFTVIIHPDTAGLPGTALSTQHNVPVTRQVTGGNVGGNTEYVYTLMLNPVILAPGTYWVEICNDTTGNPSSFFWEFGVVDPIHGIPGAAFVFTALFGSNWQVLGIDSDRQDLAIEITTQPVTTAVPTWGNGDDPACGAFRNGVGLLFEKTQVKSLETFSDKRIRKGQAQCIALTSCMFRSEIITFRTRQLSIDGAHTGLIGGLVPIVYISNFHLKVLLVGMTQRNSSGVGVLSLSTRRVRWLVLADAERKDLLQMEEGTAGDDFPLLSSTGLTLHPWCCASWVFRSDQKVRQPIVSDVL